MLKDTISRAFLLFITSLLIFSCSKTKKEANHQNDLQQEWISLFDGESLDGWKLYGAAQDSSNGKWVVEDGMIHASKDGNGPGINTGFDISLITIDTYENFELELEYRISEGGNSGIIYHVVEDTNNAMDYFTGLEFQILDDEGFEGTVRDFQYTGSLYGMFPATNKVVNPPGEWNKVRIIANNGKTEHYLNNRLIVSFDRNSEEYKEVYAASQWPEFPDWGKSQEGHIALQDHGDFVSFRNIRLRRL